MMSSGICSMGEGGTRDAGWVMGERENESANPSRIPHPPSRDVGVIIVAAGSGSRTQTKELKQFRWVAGKPMLLHSLQAFQARADVAMVVCVLPKQYVADPPQIGRASCRERV